MKIWKVFSRLILIVFILSGVGRAWYNPSGAHGTRQVDTAGLSLALAHDYKAEGMRAFAKTMLYPRVLQRGLSSGINAAEFPLLNLITAPFFLINPHWGNFLSCIFVLALNLIVAAFTFHRLLKLWNRELPRWLSPLLYFSVGSISFQAGILMPEGLAFPLLIIGAMELCEFLKTKLYPKALLGTVFLSLSVAVKPMASIGLLILMLFPWIDTRLRTNHKFSVSFYLAILISLIFPGWWYGIHAQELSRLTDGIRVFLKADFAPLTKLQEVGLMSSFKLIWRQLNSDTGQWALYSAFFWLPLALFFAPIEFGVLILSFVAVIALGGAHIWVHFYYFFGAALCSLMVLAKIVRQTFYKPVLGTFCILLLSWGVLYGVRTNIWVMARTPNWWPFADSLRRSLPVETHLVTDDFEDATHLLFMGRPGTIAGQSILTICKAEPYRSRRLALLVTESTIASAEKMDDHCLKSAKLIQTATSDFAKWKLYEFIPK